MVFRNEYYFLSNMYPCSVTVDICGKVLTFKCAESAYQAFKCPDYAEKFVPLNGYAAKKLGKTVPLIVDWNDIKGDIMRNVVTCKFNQNPNLLYKLQQIDDDIVEENTWGDYYFGMCRTHNGLYGKNVLGKILMSIRDEDR